MRKILVFEDLPTIPLSRMKLIAADYGCEIYRFASWSSFFELYNQETSILEDVALILLDHFLDDNDTFNPDGRKRAEGYHSITFYHWLKEESAELSEKVIGISSERPYQTSLRRYEGKQAVLDLSQFNDLLVEFACESGEQVEGRLAS